MERGILKGKEWGLSFLFAVFLLGALPGTLMDAQGLAPHMHSMSATHTEAGTHVISNVPTGCSRTS